MPRFPTQKPTINTVKKRIYIRRILFLILLLAAFRLGMAVQAWLYDDLCLDLGGGANHPDAGVSFPICVLDFETYRERHAR
ncbi:hypothetical protein ACG2K1_09125 [Neisseria sp. 23W00296]|uniref:hypothetical protein n=1 Tax=unclassified Neisseria TaxID=2623750 RepID=UPI0002A2BE89|nr:MULTISPECIES: hypothetical protein [unclassified Neisseria]ASP17548.1 hypothetical protein CGZ77_07195 [Neisseria sp. KEM232]EKY09803.1 hypothetical protein HMPREF9120_00235 [Neisseria sp. oral taxon 020 str. F0370]